MKRFQIAVTFNVNADDEDQAERVVNAMCEAAASSSPDTELNNVGEAIEVPPASTQQAFAIPGLNLTEPLRPVGDGDDPCARLLGRMDLGHASFHVEADQVRMARDEDDPDTAGETQQSILGSEECHYEELVELAGGYEPFETVEIPGLPGREYVLYIYPFCT